MSTLSGIRQELRELGLPTQGNERQVRARMQRARGGMVMDDILPDSRALARRAPTPGLPRPPGAMARAGAALRGAGGLVARASGPLGVALTVPYVADQLGLLGNREGTEESIQGREMLGLNVGMAAENAYMASDARDYLGMLEYSNQVADLRRELALVDIVGDRSSMVARVASQYQSPLIGQLLEAGLL